MGRHRAAAPPLRVRIDGYRMMFRPGSGDADGSFTCVDSIMAKLDAAFEAKTLVPVNGVLVEAERTTIPGVLAACHAIAERQVFVEEIPDEAEEWFVLHRAKAEPANAATGAVIEGSGGLLGRLKRKKTAEG